MDTNQAGGSVLPKTASEDLIFVPTGARLAKESPYNPVVTERNRDRARFDISEADIPPGRYMVVVIPRRRKE